MRRMILGFLGLTLVAGMGCDRNTKPGGPGVTAPKDKKAVVGNDDNTFTLSAPTLATSITQGETQNVTIGIKRGDNFAEDVALKFENMPKGVTMEPASPKIAKSETEAKVSLRAANDAAVGDFTVKVIGTPTKGADATRDMKVTVNKK